MKKKGNFVDFVDKRRKGLVPSPPAELVERKLRIPMERQSLGTKGQKIQVLTNHFEVNVPNIDGKSCHYSVAENALVGGHNSQEDLRVILRRHASKLGCLLVCQYCADVADVGVADVGGAILGPGGFHSRICTTQCGLSLNIDVSNKEDVSMLKNFSTTLIIKPGPVVNLLLASQLEICPLSLDWVKAKRTLKNLRVSVEASPFYNQVYKITGLSEETCVHQKFDNDREVTVFEHFVSNLGIKLHSSGDLPCINIGEPDQPTYIPLELCFLVSLQQYTKALSTFQRSSFMREFPQSRLAGSGDALKIKNYDAEPLLESCGVSISRNFTFLEARVLPAPKLKLGNGEDLFPRNGRWNLSHKKLVEPVKMERWAVVNFSTFWDVNGLIRDFIKCGEMKGIAVEPPFETFEESQQYRLESPLVRVEVMFQKIIHNRQSDLPKFLLCLLPKRRNCGIYGPWKKKSLSEYGIVTQCMAPMREVNDMYLSSLLLKVNAKLGGLNSMLVVEHSPQLPHVSKVPTMILGMHVSHGKSDIPSIAAVVSSRQWPLISRYRASVRTQSPKLKMIDSLFKPVSDTVDEGVIMELLLDYYVSSGKRKPDQIIIFRDGVSESQFTQVLNIELDLIIEACKFLDEYWNPKFVFIVAQKNHHTRFFQSRSPDNVPPGTIVECKICHPRNYDFYLCTHADMIGTTRPTHYHVLFDEVGFSPDELQELVHALAYVYQRSTAAISTVAPIRYAHSAATQLGTWLKFDDPSDTSSSKVPQLPRLNKDVCSSMFFC